MNRYICIHGHFYQPPRENPWLEEVELQDSAYPYHDWNERITAECYAPNTLSRILDADRRIINIVNNYSKMSFNIGPTLLNWMERHNPEVYNAILEADKESQKNFSGHGSAIAQVYNHMIMPLADSRDKRTQVIWGIEDFKHRFKRKPEGMWLAETAVDIETLEILTEFDIKFTILSPYQAKRIKMAGEELWQDVSGGKIDPKMPYLCRLPSGRNISIFFYDGPVSRELAFDKLLNSGEGFAKRMLSMFTDEDPSPQLANIATDGETYGHHHRFGDMALSYCIYLLESKGFANITVYGEYLEKNPPSIEVEIFENSSWSCAHGVERWRNNCGCNTGMNKEWNQEWREPLRSALNWLRDNLKHIYEEQLDGLLKDPWKARDSYINLVLNRQRENMDSFLSEHGSKDLTEDEKIRVLRLLEMQRYAMFMYTSCGWFFDEISGIETVQIICYAARAVQLAKMTSGVSLEEAFVSLLERAPSNIAEFQNGMNIYNLLVKPAVLDLLRVGVHYAISSIFDIYEEATSLYTYSIKRYSYEKIETGKQKIATGKISLLSNITLEKEDVSFAVLHLGDHNVVGGARGFKGEDLFSKTQDEIKSAFSKGEISEVIRLIDKNFETHSFSLWHLFKDEQRKIIHQLFENAEKNIELSFRQIFDNNVSLLNFMRGLKIPVPKYFYEIDGFIINRDIRYLLETDEFDIEKLGRLIDDSKKWVYEMDRAVLGYLAGKKIDKAVEKYSHSIEDITLMENIIKFIDCVEDLSLPLNLWKSQNIYFSMGKKFERLMRGKELESFRKLGECLKVKVL